MRVRLRSFGFVVAVAGLTSLSCDPPPAPQTAPPPSAPPPVVVASASASGPAAAPAPVAPAPPIGIPIAERLRAFAPAKLTADVSALPPAERQTLDKLIAAARLLDPVFDRQAFVAYPEVRARLAKDTTPEGKDKLAYFDIMRGPWDRQDHFAPFAIATPRPEGAGFYPVDLTRDAFKAYVDKHPDEKEKLTSLTTLVVRDGASLRAVPYGTAYAEWLDPAAKLLVEAAGITKDKSLSKFLTSRAAAFKSDDYLQSEKDWMDTGGLVDVTIGPYETYEDDLFGMKAAFEAFVTVSDPAASNKLSKYKALLPDMEKNLPIPDAMKTKRGGESPIRVASVVFTSGNARMSVQTIAFNLPNDERVRKEKGAKKVLLRNLIETKFDLILRPIAAKIIAPSQQRYLSAEAFFDETLFHELSHSLGPAFTMKDGKQVEVRVALEATHSALEEGKADIMGAYNILYLIKRGELPGDLREKLLVSYFAGLFRSTRFGVAEAHGAGAAMQINRFLEAGGATFDGERFTVDFAKLEAEIGRLVHDICVIQHDGDKPAADALLAKYGVMSEPMKKALASLGDIPVDVKPIYPLAGE